MLFVLSTMSLFWLAEIFFWTAAGIVLYAYLGYPILVYILGRVRSKEVRKADFEPSVSIIITAYNEHRDIRAKLENTLLIDYPKEKLEIIVASDCSSDGTDDIVREFQKLGVRLCRQQERLGKTSAQNLAVGMAENEIILFSDATTKYEPDVLRAMLPSFADETVGCVAGRLIYVDPERSSTGKGALTYWDYEVFLKKSESRACSLIGASGCLYAVRKSAYIPMYREACSDFLIATVVFRQGLRTVYEPRAVCTEEVNKNTRAELRMRVRVIAQTFNDLWRNREMMNPFRSGFFAIQLFSHKVLRYSLPLMFLVLFLSSAILAPMSPIFLFIFIVQILFLLVGLTAFIWDYAGFKSKYLSLPMYFILSNLACCRGFFKFVSGERFYVWEPIRKAANENHGLESR